MIQHNIVVAYLTLVAIFNGFAVHYIAYVVTSTYGPFNIFVRLRALFGVILVEVYDDDVVVEVVETVPMNKPLANLISCFWCTSVWISAIVVFATFHTSGFTSELSLVEYILTVLASSGIAGYMYTNHG